MLNCIIQNSSQSEKAENYISVRYKGSSCISKVEEYVIGWPHLSKTILMIWQNGMKFQIAQDMEVKESW